MTKKKVDLSIKDLTTRLKTITIHEDLPRVPFSLNMYGKKQSQANPIY